MIRTVLSRDDRTYQCFPDIARCPDGTLVCVYRESMDHGSFPFSRILCRRSLDGGRTWTERRIIDECVARQDDFEKAAPRLSQDAILGYEESRKRISDSSRVGMSINCPRLICLHDGQLLLVADFHRDRWINLFYRSFDNGRTWSGPEDPGVPDGVVPALTELRSGRIVLGLTNQVWPSEDEEERPKSQGSGNAVTPTQATTQGKLASDFRLVETQVVYFSDDQGRSWSSAVAIPSKEGQNLSEGSFVELDDGTLMGILRDDAMKDRRGYKVISHDDGATWSGPFPTQLLALSGRPKAGLLRSGEVCITYRIQLPNKMLGLHLMSQETAAYEGDCDRYKSDQPWHLRYGLHGRTAILDMDRRVYYDGGYSGWVQLESGDIYVVDYIIDEAPLAHIRGYLVNRSDIILFPEGALPTIAPVNVPSPVVQAAADLAERQYRRVFREDR